MDETLSNNIPTVNTCKNILREASEFLYLVPIEIIISKRSSLDVGARQKKKTTNKSNGSLSLLVVRECKKRVTTARSGKASEKGKFFIAGL